MAHVNRATIALVVLLTACGHAGPTGDHNANVVAVVAAENFWGDIAAQIGGEHVRVTSIISEPGADPHLFDATARDAARLSEAKLVILNGLGYDDEIRKLVANADGSRTVLTVGDVLGVHGHDANPHLWYDTARIPAVASAIAKGLAAIDRDDVAYFAANEARFDASLQPILDTINTIAQRHPHAPIAYTERVPGYLLDAAGLDVVTSPGFARAIEDGSEPNPRDTQAMNDAITHRRITVLVYNAQATSSTTERLRQRASDAGIAVVPMTETIPRSEASYQSWQLHQAQALLRALGG